MSLRTTINNLTYKISRTLRGKLIFWYFVSIGTIILLFSVSVSILLWATLQDQIDHHVHIAVNEASQIVQNYQSEERDGLITNLVGAQGMTVVVLSPDGAPILETNSPDVALVTEHQLQRILTSMSLFETEPVHFTESNIRFAALPVQVRAGKGIVAVGYSTQVLYLTFAKMLGIVAGVIVLIVFPLSIFGYKLLKKQLNPLENIALQAKSVTSSNSLSKRIHISSPTQELMSIQDALNAMLGKMERIFNNEREFFSDAAHTIKTPLSVLRSQIESGNIAHDLREDLMKTIDTTNGTIQDLLFLSKINSKEHHMKPVSLSKLLSDLSELVKTLGEDKNLNVLSDIQPNITIKSDKELLLKALGNIVINAVNYNKPKGTISISLKRSKSSIKVVIKDTGIGITKKDLPHVFARFYRSSNVSTSGSGLGLAISRAAIVSLNGTISIASSINKGTTITVIFQTLTK